MISRIKKYFHDRKKIGIPPVQIEKVVNTLSETHDWGLKQLNVPRVWKLSRGENVTIGVIDTGMPQHLDIGDNAIEGECFIKGEDIYDKNGHQTHCVGIINAKQNDTGMVGVAPAAKCLCVKGLSNSGSGTYGGLIAALEYCLEQQVDIVSMSLGGPTGSPQMKQVIDRLVQANIPVICAAGNSGDAGVNYPAAFDNTISVAAFDKFGRVAGFSSKGPEVDFAKPGVAVYSTYLNNTYARLSGTSMACPFMAGVVALMLSRWKKIKKSYTVQDVITQLKRKADDRGVVGKDDHWGYGVVDVEKLLQVDDQKPTPEPTKPEPTPEPDKPEPTPEPGKPEPKKPWLTPRVTWIVFGVMLSIIILAGVLSYVLDDEPDIPSPPWIDENGNVDWDKKFELEDQ